MTEGTIRRWLVKLLKPCPVKLQPIESGNTGTGIPDLYYRAEKQGGWIEFKIGKMDRKEETIKLRWESGQLNWIKEHAELNGKTFLFVGIPPGLIMIVCLNARCIEYNHTDLPIESAHYLNDLRFVSREHILSMLNYT